MSVKGVFSKGKPSNAAQNTIGVLRYLPRPRSPVQPSLMRRENVLDDELATFWDRGRYAFSPYRHHSGYYKDGKTWRLEEEDVPIIPRGSLEKFMPNIDIGNAANVTPTSMMNARAGHRVTHDLLHSYDAFVGGTGNRLTPPRIDHDNIDIHDAARVGLHPDTIGSRSRMYRWLRRGPFFNEAHYFRRTALDPLSGSPLHMRVEEPLHEKISRLARQGHLKAACEEYRRLSYVPPVDVYRALTAACVPGGKIADAVAIFEDGNSKLRWVARDFDVFRNVLKTAIEADNVERVMWLVNQVEGTFMLNTIVRARFTLLERYDLYARALEFLLDRNAAASSSSSSFDNNNDELFYNEVSVRENPHALQVYHLMQRSRMLMCDLQVAEGARLREELLKIASSSEEGKQNNNSVVKKIAAPSREMLERSKLQVEARSALDVVVSLMIRIEKQHQENSATSSSSSSSSSTFWFTDGSSNHQGEKLLQIAAADGTNGEYFNNGNSTNHVGIGGGSSSFAGVDLLFLLRHCRFRYDTDLLATKRIDDFAARAVSWIAQLSPSVRAILSCAGSAASQPLPYLPKSRAAAAVNGGEYSRVMVPPHAVRQLTRNNNNNNNSFNNNSNNSNKNNNENNGVGFYYLPSTRFVRETYPTFDLNDNSMKYLVRQPIHREAAVVDAIAGGGASSGYFNNNDNSTGNSNSTSSDDTQSNDLNQQQQQNSPAADVVIHSSILSRRGGGGGGAPMRGVATSSVAGGGAASSLSGGDGKTIEIEDDMKGHM